MRIIFHGNLITHILVIFIDSYLIVQHKEFSQYLVIVKIDGVFSSKNELLVSAPILKFHRIKEYDSV